MHAGACRCRLGSWFLAELWLAVAVNTMWRRHNFADDDSRQKRTPSKAGDLS